jgi:NitT/TauT family transport system ATP-binding protein
MHENVTPGAGHGSPASIVLEHVSKTYPTSGGGWTEAVKDVSLTVRQGEFLSILGPSGCGKSTLLRMIAGLLPVTQGRILVAGVEVKRPVTDVGIVFQKPVLLEWRTVLENVLLQPELRGADTRAFVARARDLLVSVGLEGFEDSHPRQLSGGMQQRASIARALVNDPPLLLMDEPLGALDALTREQMRVDLEELWLQSSKTVVFITHSIDDAVLLSDRVVIMSPRPGCIDHVIDIDLPRPRALAGRKHEGFHVAEEAITAIFLERGVLQRSRGLTAAEIARHTESSPATRRQTVS